MLIENKTKVNSLVFLMLFISPHIVYSVIPKVSVPYYYIFLSLAYLILILRFFYFFIDGKFRNPLFLSLTFLIFGILNLLIHGSKNFFNILSPVVAFLGYCYLFRKKIDLRIFDFFLIAMYIFFYFVYFSVIPDLFFRPGFDEDAIVFDNSSSNAIPMALNITLYAYMIMNRFYLASNNKKILVFSILNFVLTVIQQSRIGLLISVILLIISFFNYDKERRNKVKFTVYIISGILLFFFFNNILQYFEIIGNLNGLKAIDEDVRGEAQRFFFQKMNWSTFLFGYDGNFVFAQDTTTDILYTYNVFLDMWNRYGIFQLSIFFIVVLIRVIKKSKFHFPLYFFIPFFLYSMVESIFFPNFWDCIIYILLFTPKNFHTFIINQDTQIKYFAELKWDK